MRIAAIAIVVSGCWFMPYSNDQILDGCDEASESHVAVGPDGIVALYGGGTVTVLQRGRELGVVDGGSPVTFR